MKFTLLISALLLAASVQAAPAVCTFDYLAKGTTLTWKAFKTPKKVGVSAKFTKFKITAKKNPTLAELLSSASFSIEPSAIDTGDKARDMKIFQFFFKKMMKNKKITGKVISATDSEVSMELEMNGVKKVVPLTAKYDESVSLLTLNGSIDVLEFSMKENLEALTKACFEKHEGVTWPNVELELVAGITKSCK
ncbi:MAG: YceI family protein [Bacteriovoracaceae bacterium]